jgi:preprotein translocase subunit YajC
VIRPQQKRTKQHKEMVSHLTKGDEVYTDSGILGTIQKVAEDSVTLEIAPKVSVRVLRNRIGEKVKESKILESTEKKGKKKKGA